MNRDEDLLLFRDMYKREKNDLASFLLPVSDELESNGNYALYRMASSKKGQVGLDNLMTESGKSDYDWLKTPPATPLFPSLDMESNAPELVIQKEIPIIQSVTLSRFADKSGAAKTRSTLIIRSASPHQKPKVATRNFTPTGKQQGVSSIDKKNTRYAATTTTITTANQQKVIKSNNSIDQNAIRTTRQKETHLNFLASNLSKTMGMESSLSSKPKSRGVSPAGRPKILAQTIPGFSDETPVNLRTDRSLSATRGRSINQHQSTNQRPGSSSSSSSSSSVHITKPTRRQSCSPSVTRGRKQDIITSNTKFQQGYSTTQVLGSKMVDKFMNARKSVYEEKEITKAKLNGSINENSGFGRHISRISANLVLKHMVH
ncbi:PREDICTED: uncharacterized protein LOC109234662 [Nicotiana attenuata]|uniref:uncharacterized protein LOC109234662 n=1 Tax=Nicotiana attenuata TaxID=49451 RepID=UPI0009059320|nr:PREDICTED: uncharacterized protein LOC109234662 [Nicotiana attenuata]